MAQRGHRTASAHSEGTGGTPQPGDRSDRVAIGAEAAQGCPSGRHPRSKAGSRSRGPTTLLLPTPAWVGPGLRLRGRGLARRPSCGRAPAAVGESRVGWGAAARVPQLLERRAGGLKRGRASSHGLLAHRAWGSGGSGPRPCRAARGALGPGGARSLGRGAAGPGGNRPLSAPPAGSRRPVVPRGVGDCTQRFPVLTECADRSLENARSETPCCSGGP